MRLSRFTDILDAASLLDGSSMSRVVVLRESVRGVCRFPARAHGQEEVEKKLPPRLDGVPAIIWWRVDGSGRMELNRVACCGM